LAANLFEAKIEIIYVDGSINNNDKKKFEVSKKIFSCDENKISQHITLLCNLNCFFKAYHLEDFLENKSIYKRYASRIQDIIFDENKFACEFCNVKENNKKVYFKSQLICACIKCISKNTDTIINSRFYNYQKDCFLSRECNII